MACCTRWPGVDKHVGCEEVCSLKALWGLAPGRATRGGVNLRPRVIL